MKPSKIVLFLLLLASFHLINIIVIFTFNQLEPKIPEDVETITLGFNFGSRAEKELDKRSAEFYNRTVVVSAFDWRYAGVYHIQTPQKGGFVSLGRFIFWAPPGKTVISLSPFETVLVRKPDGTVTRKKMIRNTLLDKMMAKIRSKRPRPVVSYMPKPMEKTRYLAIPHILRFFLPMLIIFAVALALDKALLSAFLYYFTLAFLFDFQQVLVEFPFGWLLRLLHIQFTPEQSMIASIVLLVCFFLLSLVGLRYRFAKEGVSWRNAFILFFFLLPFAWRF